MKYALLAALLFLGCSEEPRSLPGSVDTSRSAHTRAVRAAIEQVANDDQLLCDALILAVRKGTLQEALTKAARDTAVGIKMREALILDQGLSAFSIPRPIPTVKKRRSATPAVPATAKLGKSN